MDPERTLKRVAFGICEIAEGGFETETLEGADGGSDSCSVEDTGGESSAEHYYYYFVVGVCIFVILN